MSNLNVPHIAEVGELFGLDDSFNFLSDQNMLEYEFIVIDSEEFTNEINDKYSSAVLKRFEDLKEFTVRKNMPVVFFCGSENHFEFKNGKNTDYIYQYLGISVEEESSSGRKIEVNIQSSFAEFTKKYLDDLEYVVGFKSHPGISIGNAKSKKLSVGFYTENFVFLPTISEYNSISFNEFLDELYAICKNIRSDQDPSQLPQWACNFLLPGESDSKKKLEEVEAKIAQLEADRILCQNQLNTFLPLKQLWSASGAVLENSVKFVFEELGFVLLETEPGRDDIIMKWRDQIVVVEIKGQTKSAAEKHAAQLEKWLSTYLSNHGVEPKGILLVNTYREQPLSKRLQPSFPDQMLPYSVRRNHCLITTVELCNLLLHCRFNPSELDEEVSNLLNTVGRYIPDTKWDAYIKFSEPPKKRGLVQQK